MNCPICQKPVDAGLRPFCSKRCADIDLARWLNGGYALPSSDPDDFEQLEDAMDAALQSAKNAQDEKLH